MLDDVRKSLKAVARDALNQATTYSEAAELLLAEAQSDDALYRALVGPFERQAALDAIRNIAGTVRETVWNRPTEPDARASILARGVAATLLDFRLPSGQRLADATADDLTGAADFYHKRAADMAWKARWLSAVAAGLPKRKRVGDKFTDSDLAKLQAETQR